MGFADWRPNGCGPSHRAAVHVERLHDDGLVLAPEVHGVPIWQVILISWGIALFEYSPAELKTIQEVITLVVFSGFAAVHLKERLTWMDAVGFAFIVVGAGIVFMAKS